MPRTIDYEKAIAETQLQVESDPTLRIQAMSRINVVTYLKLLEKCVAEEKVLSHAISDALTEYFDLKEQAGSLNLNSSGKQIAKALALLLEVDPAEAVRYVFEQKALEVFHTELENRRKVATVLASA